METFLLSRGSLIFVAEMGDKTSWWPAPWRLVSGRGWGCWGSLSPPYWCTFFPWPSGVLLSRFLSPGWIELVSGLAFVSFGLLDHPRRISCMRSRKPRHEVPYLSFSDRHHHILPAELGDKTMLGTVTLAANHSLIPVWIGSSLGMVIADGLAIWVGSGAGEKLPEKEDHQNRGGRHFFCASAFITSSWEQNELWQICCSCSPEGTRRIKPLAGSATRRTG